jgi:uncharacterized protein YlxW (UPF0749 family)
MTFVGKVLVFVQLALSLLFMAFAGAVYSVHTNWRDAHDKSKAQVQDLQTDLQNREQELANLQKESETSFKAEQQLREAAEATNRGLETQVAELENRVASLTAERNQLQTSSQIAEKESLARREEAMKLRELNRALHASLNEADTKVRNLEDQVYNQDLTITQMDAKHKGILEQMAQLERIIRLNDLETDPNAYAELQDPPPEVTGVVMNTRAGQTGRSDLVEISLGSDDGLSRGHNLYVYRNQGDGKYLGRISLVYVTPDRAVGAVMEKSRNGVISEGDYVTSKL